ncbi:MAG: 5-formyltetrahydrofolate cyclo-ligase [Desulfitobacterium sp.]|nr:5-formyltetrahydrofolate cyclo-ligase [Desulfitobacterium sp.]
MSEEKRLLREEVLARRNALGEEERRKMSQEIRRVVSQLEEFKNASTIMVFLDFGGEVETTDLAQQILDQGKRLITPRCAPKRVLIPALIKDLEKDLEPGMWGIREPKKEGLIEVDPQEIDCIIMPGVAFDLDGNRLGYGGGFYDRFLERVRPETPRIAIAFHCQIVDKVPVGEFDKKIHMLVTEQGVMRFS